MGKAVVPLNASLHVMAPTFENTLSSSHHLCQTLQNSAFKKYQRDLEQMHGVVLIKSI